MIKALNLSKTFDGLEYIFKDLSLELKSGDIFFIKGKSGSGKTLFLKSLCLLTDFQEGKLFWGGKEIEGADVPQFRSEVHFLNQFPSPFQGTVLDYLKIPFSFSLNKKKLFNKEELDSFLKDLHLKEDFLKKRVPHLSGGEKQLLKIIRSLLLHPKGFLLDEPTSSMDEEMKKRTEELIFKVHKKRENFILWVTHDEAQIKRNSKTFYHFPSLKKEVIA
ncbi:MAG: ATP-binding cassette domain-containing protein [Bdellovibrionota bacterium]|nr:ATP-binding cassette domain-containing protein [Bdellovibrionota bacterium]